MVDQHDPLVSALKGSTRPIKKSSKKSSTSSDKVNCLPIKDENREKKGKKRISLFSSIESDKNKEENKEEEKVQSIWK